MTVDNSIAERRHAWGTIKTLTSRGFGFIAAEGEQRDIFFHSRSLQGMTFDELKVGHVVSFEIEQGSKGPEAVEIVHDAERRQGELHFITSNEPPSGSSADSVTIESIEAVTDAVIRCLARNPRDLYRLHPKMFEELISEIFMREGYTTELIKSWNQADGGVDIIAVRRDIGGYRVRYAIQCKRNAAHNRISADPIRALAGVLDRFQAHVGVIATTSYFTEPAKKEVEGHLWKINLRDYESIVAALKRLDLLRQ